MAKQTTNTIIELHLFDIMCCFSDDFRYWHLLNPNYLTKKQNNLAFGLLDFICHLNLFLLINKNVH